MTKQEFERNAIFPAAELNPYGKYFTGKSYLSMLASGKVPVGNVVFEPSCINNWHAHSGGQILLVTGGRGYYCEWGKPARELHPGDVVEIGASVKHWHGAAKDSWFSHISIEIPGTEQGGWYEPVSQADYNKLK